MESGYFLTEKYIVAGQKKTNIFSPKEMLCTLKAIEVFGKSREIGFSLLNPQSCWAFKLKLLQEGGTSCLLLTQMKHYCLCFSISLRTSSSIYLATFLLRIPHATVIKIMPTLFSLLQMKPSNIQIAWKLLLLYKKNEMCSAQPCVQWSFPFKSVLWSTEVEQSNLSSIVSNVYKRRLKLEQEHLYII